MRVKIAAGNWKMNTDAMSGQDLAAGLVANVGGLALPEVLIFPPFPYLHQVGQMLVGSKVQLGAQNCYCEPKGAFTGEVSPAMLRDVGCTWVLVGHSERRHILGESDEFLQRKVTAALAAGLRVVFCVGETLEQRQANQTESVVEGQLAAALGGLGSDAWTNLVIAYEPVWAIGTGVNATPDQAQEVHRFIRSWLEKQVNANVASATRILYGGSVTAQNAASLLGQADVDGALVGGASLKVDDFTTIVRAAV